MPTPTRPPLVHDLGPKIRAWRLAEGISQEEAARRIGVFQTAWSKWEAGKQAPEDVGHLLWLEVHVGIPLEAWSTRPEEAGALLAAVIAGRTQAAAPGVGVVERALAAVDELRVTSLAAFEVLRVELQGELAAARKAARARSHHNAASKAA